MAQYVWALPPLHPVAGCIPCGLAHLQKAVHSGKTSQSTFTRVALSFPSPTLLTQLQLAETPAGLHCLENGLTVSQLQRGSWLLPHSHAHNLLLLLAAWWVEQVWPLLNKSLSRGCVSPSQGLHLGTFFSIKIPLVKPINSFALE